MGWGAMSGLGQGLMNVGQSVQEDLKTQRIQEWKEKQAGIERQFRKDEKASDRDHAATLLAEQREYQEGRDGVKMAHDKDLANIRASGRSSSNKLNPYLKTQIEGIDNKLKSLYENSGDPKEISRLEQQRTFLLGGGIASQPSSASGEPNPKAVEPKSKSSGLLDDKGRSANFFNFVRGGIEDLHSSPNGESGSSIPIPEFLRDKKDSVISDIETGRAPDKALLKQVWPYLSPAEKAKAESL